VVDGKASPQTDSACFLGYALLDGICIVQTAIELMYTALSDLPRGDGRAAYMSIAGKVVAAPATLAPGAFLSTLYAFQVVSGPRLLTFTRGARSTEAEEWGRGGLGAFATSCKVRYASRAPALQQLEGDELPCRLY
jgi:hypothetical protein